VAKINKKQALLFGCEMLHECIFSITLIVTLLAKVTARNIKVQYDSI